MRSRIPTDIRAFVLRRDGYRCVAPEIDREAGWCRDTWGNVITSWPPRDRGPEYLQMSHTKDADKLSMSKKAPSDPRHLATLCPHHHMGTTAGSNWEAVHRDQIRTWLARLP